MPFALRATGLAPLQANLELERQLALDAKERARYASVCALKCVLSCVCACVRACMLACVFRVCAHTHGRGAVCVCVGG